VPGNGFWGGATSDVVGEGFSGMGFAGVGDDGNSGTVGGLEGAWGVSVGAGLGVGVAGGAVCEGIGSKVGEGTAVEVGTVKCQYAGTTQGNPSRCTYTQPVSQVALLAQVVVV